MTERAPQTPNAKKEDFEQTAEYKRYLVIALQLELERLVLPAGFRQRIYTAMDSSDLDINDFANPEDYAAAVKEITPGTKEELETLSEIENLEDIEDIRLYCKIYNVKLDINKFIEEVKKDYIRDAKRVTLLKDKLYEDPKVQKFLEFVTGENPEEEKPN